MKTKREKALARETRTRSKILGDSKRPRLSVFKSNQYLYAQLIDDTKGHTLVSSSGRDASKVGAEIAKKARGKKIAEVVFDRGRFRYHGKVKRLAESAREGGLKF